MFTTIVLAAMLTPWGESVTSENCWRLYPRPQLVRADWTCLNGDWDYAITSFRVMVFIGHNEVTDVPHAGAQEPFVLDITDFVRPGVNELTVCVWDPTQNHIGSYCKQCFKPSGCFYTRCSGIDVSLSV